MCICVQIIIFRVNQFMKLLKETKLPGAGKLNVNQVELLIRQAPTADNKVCLLIVQRDVT